MKWYRTVIICAFSLSILFTSFLHALDVPNLPDATAPLPGSVIVPPSASIRIVAHHGEWTSFFSTGGSSEPFFLITGQFENTSGKPLTYAKFQFELLSKDGV